MNHNQYNVSSIVKNSPIPAKVRHAKASNSPLVERLEKLKNAPVGASFIVSGGTLRDIHPKVYAASKRLGMKIVTRSVPDGVQIWHAADNASTKSTRKVA